MAGSSADQAPPAVTLILAGDVGLGAYQAGAYGVLDERLVDRPLWVAGSSIGGVNAALIAGSPVDQRSERLRALWDCDDCSPATAAAPGPGILAASRRLDASPQVEPE